MVFVCVKLKIWWQSFLSFKHLSTWGLSASHDAAVNLQVPITFFCYFYLIMLKIAHKVCEWERKKCVLNNASVCTKQDCESVCVCHILLPFENNMVRGTLRSLFIRSWGFCGLSRDLTPNWTGPEVDQTLSYLSEHHLTLTSGLMLHTADIMDFIFWSTVSYIFYILHDICTFQLYLKSCSRQTDMLSSCASVAKCLVKYCRHLDTQRTFYFVEVTSRNFSIALFAVFCLHFS